MKPFSDFFNKVNVRRSADTATFRRGPLSLSTDLRPILFLSFSRCAVYRQWVWPCGGE